MELPVGIERRNSPLLSPAATADSVSELVFIIVQVGAQGWLICVMVMLQVC